jgi:hypothetical protein
MIIKDFWIIKIWSYFHKSIWVAIIVYFSISLSQKHMFLKALHSFVFCEFSLRLPNLKMTSVTLNTSSYINLGRFVNDWTCIIQKLG